MLVRAIGSRLNIVSIRALNSEFLCEEKNRCLVRKQVLNVISELYKR